MLHKNYMKVLASLKQTVTRMRLLWSWDYEEQVRKMLRIFLTDNALSSKVPQLTLRIAEGDCIVKFQFAEQTKLFSPIISRGRNYTHCTSALRLYRYI